MFYLMLYATQEANKTGRVSFEFKFILVSNATTLFFQDEFNSL